MQPARCRSELLPITCHTFCELEARLSFAKSDAGSTVPRKMGLNWFMPALLHQMDRSMEGQPQVKCRRLAAARRFRALRMLVPRASTHGPTCKPADLNSSVGSFTGTTGDESTGVWPFDWKNSTNVDLTRATGHSSSPA